MKKIILILIAIALVCIIGFFIGISNQKEQYRIVKLAGGDGYANLTKSDFSWIAGENKDSISALPLNRGDLLYVFFEEEKLPLYRYQESDGDYLKFQCKDFILYLNDKIIALEITEDTNFVAWLENLNAEIINDLRYISISSEFSDVNLPYLKKIADIKPDIGIFFDENTTILTEILNLFNPTWLAAPDCELDKNIQNRIAKLKNLELLYIDPESCNLSNISKLKNLENLILTNMHQSDSTRFIENNNLRAVSIIESEITNISFLSKLTNLSELNLINCEELSAINSIDKLINLESLSLINCEDLTDISILSKMQTLKWLSFNPGITQEELDSLAVYHKNIEVVELINCENIRNINSFDNLKKLTCLSVYNTDIDINSLYDLKGLRYLSIPDSIYSDSLKISQIQAKIPNCIIVPSSGLCLGSGWFLLIIPALIICKIFSLLYKKIKI